MLIFEDWSNSPWAYAAKIILVDQFSRHVYRGAEEKIKVNDKISLTWSQNLIQKGWHKFLPVNQHVFALMPLRHSNIEENLNIVLLHIEEREAVEGDNTTWDFHLFFRSLFLTLKASGKIQKNHVAQNL